MLLIGPSIFDQFFKQFLILFCTEIYLLIEAETKLISSLPIYRCLFVCF